MNPHKPFVYIVDDDISIGRALKLLLKQHGFRVETFTRATDFLEFKPLRSPACLVLDIRLPDINGLALMETMATQQRLLPIIFITGHGDIPMSVKAMKGGAVDFLSKPFGEKELLNAIQIAIEKSHKQIKTQNEINKIKRLVNTLSPRELEVFRLVAKGMLNKEIAYQRGKALQTIKVQRSQVMQKMQVKTVTELIHLAEKAGLIPSRS